MPSEIPDEYEIDPGTDIDQIAALFVDEYPDAIIRDFEEGIFVDDGPVDYLAWLALDGYDRHEFFYYDRDPDPSTVRRLLSMSPDETEMSLLQAYFTKHFDVVQPIEFAAFLEVPDPYLPGSKPGANVAFYQNPVDDVVNVGLNTTPLEREEEILDDVDKVVPAKDLETFARNVIHAFFADVEREVDRRELQGDVRGFLESDSRFQLQTEKSIPEGTHPLHDGQTAELWQTPVSNVDAVEGSGGFVQIWLPESEDGIGVISVTDGPYDGDKALDAIRSSFENRL